MGKPTTSRKNGRTDGGQGATRGAHRWRELIDAQQRSGLSIAAFCRKRGLSSSTFHYWQRRFRAESLDGQADADPSGFVRVEAAVGPESPVEAHLPCGTTLRVPAERLEELVRVLRKEGV